jgi:hypothetical protein
MGGWLVRETPGKLTYHKIEVWRNSLLNLEPKEECCV